MKDNRSSRPTRRDALLMAAASAALTPRVAQAQAWPQRMVRLVVPFAGGGPIDLQARLIANRLSEKWGQTVLVDNRPGGGGSIGTAFVAAAPPDGHTILLHSIPHVTTMALVRLPYHPIEDFTAITGFSYQPGILCVSPSTASRSVQEFVQLARRAPGDISVGSAGVGTISHLMLLDLEQRAGIRLTHVPFAGSSQAMTALLGGHITSTFLNPTLGVPQFAAGRLVPLGVSSTQRWRELPDVPTIEEVGFPGYECIAWYAILGPARMSQEIVTRLYTDIQAVVKEDASREALYRAGLEVWDQGPDELRTMMQSDLTKWSRVIAAAGIARQ